MRRLAVLTILTACSHPHPAPTPAPVAPLAPVAPIAPPAPPAAAEPPVPASPVASRPAPEDPAALEAARRTGKHLGLTKGEKPDVLSEELLRAIAKGTVKLDRFVDPKHKVAIIDQVGSPCGPDEEACKKANKPKARTALQYVQAMVKAESADLPMSCDNTFVGEPDPTFGSLDRHGEPDPKRAATPTRYASCTVPGAAEYAESFHVVFVPDATRGLRLAAAVSIEVGNPTVWTTLLPTL
jgi:hypothetical protein